MQSEGSSRGGAGGVGGGVPRGSRGLTGSCWHRTYSDGTARKVRCCELALACSVQPLVNHRATLEKLQLQLYRILVISQFCVFFFC